MLHAAGEAGEAPKNPRRGSAVLVAALAATSLGGWRLGTARSSAAGRGDGPPGGTVRVAGVVDG
ncbi:MAG TPA: hypothetical protein VGQ80_01430, partial [Acidimicrobiia bacterium]|nr:hypothetical protein [Acidimicrobiia bacterium]